VSDALSRRPYLVLSYLLAPPNELCEEFRKLEINTITPREKSMVCTLEAQLTLIEEIRVAQATDPPTRAVQGGNIGGKNTGFVIHEDSTI